MEAIEFTVEGIPQGKGRPRAFRCGKGIRTYTPQPTVIYENLVKMTYRQKFPGRAMMEGPIALTIRAYMPIPASRPKKFHAAAASETIPHTSKPDFSNIQKAVEDALNLVAWRDDSQVSAGGFKKRYSPRPRLEVRIDSDGGNAE